MKRAASIRTPPLTLDRRRALVPQIAAGLSVAIETGRLRPGDRVPSTRRLAGAVGVSRQVVVQAYEELIAAGRLSGRVGDGSYVLDAPRQLPPAARVLHDPDGFGIEIRLL